MKLRNDADHLRVCLPAGVWALHQLPTVRTVVRNGNRREYRAVIHETDRLCGLVVTVPGC
jgi:cytochrome P450